MKTRITYCAIAGSILLVLSSVSPLRAATPIRDAEQEAVTQHLRTFDTLDFDVYSHERWDRLKESHAANILVHYPDGSTTQGLAAHIAALKPMFVFAPDTSIKVHPVKFGSGPWTAVIGVIEGHFTRPMPIPGGKQLAPTGHHFKLEMTTLGHWTAAGVMDEEYLFWDNASLMKQLGV